MLSSYSTMMYLAATLTIVLGLVVAVRRGLPFAKVLFALILMAIATPIGARLWHAAINWDLFTREPERLFSLDYGSFSMYGGLTAAATVGLLICRLLAVDVVRLADSVAPAIGVGLALVRVGCFLAGCCYGQETDLPWGIVFPFASNVYLHQIASGGLFFSREPLPVHPTQLIELTGALVGVVIATWLLYKKAVDGTAFLTFAIVFSSFRWGDYYLLVKPATLTIPGWFYPLLYFVIIVVCSWLLLLRRHPSVLTFWQQRLGFEKRKPGARPAEISN